MELLIIAALVIAIAAACAALIRVNGGYRGVIAGLFPPRVDVEALLNDPEALERMRASVTSIGFLHNADRARNILTDHIEKDRISELFIIRLNGDMDTLETRRRGPKAIQDAKGEERARRLADALDLELHIA